MLRYPGNKLTAIEVDEILQEGYQPLRKATKTGFPALWTCYFLPRQLLESVVTFRESLSLRILLDTCINTAVCRHGKSTELGKSGRSELESHFCYLFIFL